MEDIWENLRKRSPLEHVIFFVAVLMSIFHVQVAYSGGYEPIFQRALSYLFGMTLIFLVFPIRKSKEGESDSAFGRTTSPFFYISIALLVLVILSIGYPILFTEYFLGTDELERIYYVTPLTFLDMFLGTTVLLLTLEAARRTINNALPLIGLFFLVYSYFGPYFPWWFGHKGASFMHIIDHQYMTYDGLWTAPLSVFSVYIFLFILFGAFLDRMGAATFYVELSTAAAGRLRGGPAKSAIFASAMTGTIMGSANANIVTTGSFTIPMMKKTGFKPEIAAAIETAASTGGQIMPPVMGASAFLIVEFTGISYWEIVKVSILPAILYFYSVYAVVHLEARKAGLVPLSKDQVEPVWPILKKGWYFLLPPIVIIAVLMTGRPVPYAGLAGILCVILLAGLKGAAQLIRTKASIEQIFRTIIYGLWNIVEAMAQGARQSLAICAAVGVVGIIIGALFQTGLGLKFSEIVTALSYGYLFLGIILVGIASFVLGMGLPTSAAYIVLSVVAVPALLDLGESYGMTLLAAHLIVFWYSLDSCFTPPVCVPAYTAAGIADANPSKAAWASFRTAKGMYVIPFMFAYTPILLISEPIPLLETFTAAMFGFTSLAAAIVGHMYLKLKVAERFFLAFAAALMFWPAMTIFGIYLPSIGLHLAGLLLLGSFFLYQRNAFLRLNRPV